MHGITVVTWNFEFAEEDKILSECRPSCVHLLLYQNGRGLIMVSGRCCARERLKPLNLYMQRIKTKHVSEQQMHIFNDVNLFAFFQLCFYTLEIAKDAIQASIFEKHASKINSDVILLKRLV